ncbi:MAG: glycosyltransferase [Acidimicrobiaceae bacterium]|nr:glycosyltransferase [Acidimicrobiaceae bacterium]
MPTLVDLLVCELREHDATSTHTLLLRDLLVKMGAEVRLVVERKIDHVSDHAYCHAQDIVLTDRWRSNADLTILQHSTGSELAERVIGNRLPIVLNYHNITPPELFEAWQPELVTGLVSGQRQLHYLAPLTLLGIADTHFNSRDMIEAGMTNVVVVPVLRNLKLIDPQLFPASGAQTEAADSATETLLFVGRLVPNKCFHDLILALSVLIRYRPKARLVLIGREVLVDYKSRLEALAERLGVRDRVLFAGEVSDQKLAAWYERADVFVCLSEHEGFCVPLVEAMAYGVPVVAYDAAAVAETVQDAGVVLNDKRPTTVATAVERVLSDQSLRDLLCDRGIRRANQLDVNVTSQRMRRALAGFVD